MAFSFSLLAANSFAVAGALFAVVLVLVALAKIPLSTLKIYTFVIGWMMVISFVLYSIFSPPTSGPIYLQFGPLSIGLENLSKWSLVALKWFTMSYITAFLLVSTKERDIIAGLRTWRAPYIVCFVIASIFRQLAVVAVDLFTIMEAQMSRGLDYRKGNVVTRLARFVKVGIPLLFVSFKKTEEMSNAMASRGFHVKGSRTVFRTIPLRPGDYALIGILGIVTVVIMANGYFGMF